MSEFFRALSQAGRDRALQGQPRSTMADHEATATDRTPESPPAAASSLSAPPTSSPSPVAGVAGSIPRSRQTRPPREREATEGTDGAGEGLDSHFVSLVMPATLEAEQYRVLRHMIEQLHTSALLKIVAVSSPTVGDGKTTTAINLAGALAQAMDARVLLVDADLRRPTVTERLGLGTTPSVGLVGAIVDRSLTVSDVVRRRPPFNLDVLPAGERPGAPYEVLKSPRLGELLEQARERYDYVIVDSSPLVSVPDCRVIARWVDSFLVVVAAHRTPKRLVEEALNVLDPTKLLGLLYNGDDRPVWRYDGYAYASTSTQGNGHSRWRQWRRG